MNQLVDWVSAIGAWFSGIVVAGSLVFLIIQIRAMKLSSQSMTYQTIVQMFDDFARIIIDRPELKDILFGTQETELPWAKNRRAPTTDDIRALWAAFIRLDWFESVAIQNKYFKAIPKEVWKHWEKVMIEDSKTGMIGDVWRQWGGLYHPILKEILANKTENKTETRTYPNNQV